MNSDEQISDVFITIILVLTYGVAILVVPYYFVEEGHVVVTISDVADRVVNILILVWAFKAGKRMNTILGAFPGGGTGSTMSGLFYSRSCILIIK